MKKWGLYPMTGNSWLLMSLIMKKKMIKCQESVP